MNFQEEQMNFRNDLNEIIKDIIVYFTKTFNVIDPLINIWMLSRYPYFSDLRITYSIFLLFTAASLYNTTRVQIEMTEVMLSLISFLARVSFYTIHFNFFLNFGEFLLTTVEKFYTGIISMKEDHRNIFLNKYSVLFFFFVYVSYIIIFVILYQLRNNIIVTDITRNKYELKLLNNISFILVIGSLFTYFHIFFPYHFLLKRIVFIGIFTFFSTILIRLLAKSQNSSIMKYLTLYITSFRLIYILLFLNQICYDHLVFSSSDKNLEKKSFFA